MDKRIACGLVGAAAAFGALGPTSATALPTAGADPLAAQSYADLLTPVPNAKKILTAMDEKSAAGQPVRMAQYYYHDHHHHHHGYWGYHHHHHHGYWGRRWHHHHHHHRYYYDDDD